ncbi:hypothetical protein QAD02_005463 [Eretmocerus hayati]|uniref:Uncharacterized protein n=1 Tax=Eretmocerus hayati TaxID=131215 RepID=A0ACC2NUB4_9HYME|nr:hypothetical protein QAD02_005463 [Eretmocerus hayati]
MEQAERTDWARVYRPPVPGSSRYADPACLSGDLVAAEQRLRHDDVYVYEYGGYAARGPSLPEIRGPSPFGRELLHSLDKLELRPRSQQYHLPQLHQHQHCLRQEQLLHHPDLHPHGHHLAASSWCGVTDRPYATLPQRRRRRRGSSTATPASNFIGGRPVSRCSAAAAIELSQHFKPRDVARLSGYPSSLRDLKYLEIEAILGRDPVSLTPPSSRLVSAVGARAQDNLITTATTTTMNPKMQGIVRRPGKVRYEPEYRLRADDNSLALVFYKTCYL